MLRSIMSTSLITYIGQQPLFLSSFVHFVFQQNRDTHGAIFEGNATWYMSRRREVKRGGEKDKVD